MNEVQGNKKKVGIMIIVVILLIISAFAIYTKVIMPKKYMSYINEGNQYLSEERYEGAVEAFQNAMKIKESSTDAKYGEAKAYIGLNNIEKAKEILRKIIGLDVENENLLWDVLQIINDKDLNFSNEIIGKYVEKVGVDNVSDKFRTEIIEYTDRFELYKAIERAEELHNNSVEGKEEGQYEEGSKAVLLGMINECKKFSTCYLIEQSEVDIMTRRIKESITNFEDKMVKPFPEELMNSYISKLKEIEDYVNASYNMDLSNAEMGGISYEAQKGYESILSEIYSDLYKHLPASKKSLVEADENNYESEREQTQYEFDNMDPMMIGTWLVTGIPDAFAELAKENCYNLIDKYMK